MWRMQKNSHVITRMKKEVKDLQWQKDDSFSVALLQNDEQKWLVTIYGPKTTPYEGQKLFLRMLFTDNYPFKPPKCQFLTKIHHPNIMENGEISVDILEHNWCPALTGRTVILSIISLLCCPEFHHASSKEFIQNQSSLDTQKHG